MESQPITCPNQTCGKVFTNPLKATNFGSKGAKPYDACPYCLTEIIVEENPTPVVIDSMSDVKTAENKWEQPLPLREEKPALASPRAQACPHHLGYLNKRSSKEKIPESCMMCENIVQCMLKNVTG